RNKLGYNKIIRSTPTEKNFENTFRSFSMEMPLLEEKNAAIVKFLMTLITDSIVISHLKQSSSFFQVDHSHFDIKIVCIFLDTGTAFYARVYNSTSTNNFLT
ncbi:hypothetical protein OTU49_016142, partial [Cherax quadricarinatus]